MRADEPPGPAPPDAEPSPALKREFWVLVVVFDVAILAAGTGVLMLVFDVRPDLGWTALILGVAAFAYGYGRYRRRERQP